MIITSVGVANSRIFKSFTLSHHASIDLIFLHIALRNHVEPVSGMPRIKKDFETEQFCDFAPPGLSLAHFSTAEFGFMVTHSTFCPFVRAVEIRRIAPAGNPVRANL
jgi:hypothetical protein